MIDQVEQQWSRMNNVFKTYNDCINEPIMAIAQLNAKTANNLLAENSWYFENLLEARKPEDLMSLNIELANKNGRDLANYSQELSRIVTKSFSRASESLFNMWNTVATDVTRSSEQIKSMATPHPHRQTTSHKKRGH